LIAGLQVPIDVVKSITSIVPNILSVQVQNATSQDTLMKMQADMLAQQIQIIKENQQLKQLENNSSKP
jgi:hypothetical protein